MAAASAAGCALRVLNPITGATHLCHHPVFGNFTGTTLTDAAQLLATVPVGTSSMTRVPLVVDWLGVRVPRGAFCHVSYVRQRIAHSMRSQLCDLLQWASEAEGALPLPLPMPQASEEYFEYSARPSSPP